MFRINPAPTFRAKVPLTVPGEDKRGLVEFVFRHKTRQQFAAWWEAIEGRKDADILADVVAGWEDVIDEQGEPVPYSPEALALLIDRFPASAAEILLAYRRGLWESREKN